MECKLHFYLYNINPNAEETSDNLITQFKQAEGKFPPPVAIVMKLNQQPT